MLSYPTDTSVAGFFCSSSFSFSCFSFIFNSCSFNLSSFLLRILIVKKKQKKNRKPVAINLVSDLATSFSLTNHIKITVKWKSTILNTMKFHCSLGSQETSIKYKHLCFFICLLQPKIRLICVNKVQLPISQFYLAAAASRSLRCCSAFNSLNSCFACRNTSTESSMKSRVETRVRSFPQRAWRIFIFSPNKIQTNVYISLWNQ